MSSPGNLAFGVQALDCFIRIECTNAELCNTLERYVFPPLPRTGPASAAADIDVRVEQGPDQTRVLINGELAATALTVENAALATVKALDDAVVRRLKRFRAIHAGAVLIDGKALLFPGSTHAGKSSLVAELLRCGASHFSDEYALIDTDGLTHSYPRPLLLRNGRPLQSLVLPAELNASFASSPAPVGWILGIDYIPGGQWELRPLSQGEAVMLLLRNTPHEMAESPQMVDFFLRVAANAVCFEGTRGEASEAAEHVLDLIRRSA